jgi:BA14K-like protein
MQRLLNCAGLALLLSSLPAHADVTGHCEAYAKDFANAYVINRDEWQKRNDEALAACLFQYEPTKSAPAKPKPKIVAAIPEAKPEKPNPLVKGTPEWNAYCEKKYVSFKVETGTYIGRSGKERPCLVTAE